jgi:hypothetical protein
VTAVVGHNKGGEAQLEPGVRWWWRGSLARDEEDGGEDEGDTLIRWILESGHDVWQLADPMMGEPPKLCGVAGDPSTRNLSSFDIFIHL